MSLKEPNVINKKWALQILFILQNNQKVSYGTILKVLQIPRSTLNRRLNELVQYKYLTKFIYSSKSKPHHTEYQITRLALDNINNLFSNTIY